MAVKNLTAEQKKALAALIAGKTKTEAAALAEVTERSVYRWLAEDDDFADAYHDGCNRVHENNIALIQSAQAEAFETLRECLKSPDPAISIRAAVALTDGGFRAAERFQDVRRMKRIEAKLNERQLQALGSEDRSVLGDGDAGPAPDVVSIEAG